MLYQKQGQPEEGEIVLCKVTKIYPNSVFIDMLEYRDSGMIHISEVSPGRIRNLRDYVSVGRQIVCKILRIDRHRGHIDLSLRRVNSNERMNKLDEIKQELKAEQIVKNLAKKLKKPFNQLYKEISTKIFKEYSHIYLCFKDVADGEVKFEEFSLPTEISKELTEIVLDKFKPKKITIKCEIIFKTYSPNGIEKIKSTLLQIDEISSNINLHYLGAGRHQLIIEDFEFKPAEDNLKKVKKILTKFEDKSSTVEFSRTKGD